MNEIRRIETRCPDAASLGRVAEDLADGYERAAVFRHARSCTACGETLVALWLADTPGTPEQEALLASSLGRAVGPIPVPPTRSRPLRIVRNMAAAAALACAAGVGLWVATAGDVADQAVLALASGVRPTEGRLSLDLPHAPYRPTRGDETKAHDLDRALAQLLTRKRRDPAGSARQLAMLYLIRAEPGDLGRADAELLAAPPGPERDNDRAVVLLAQGRAQEAIQAAQKALGARHDFVPARFNLALALDAVGRKAEAARAFRDYLAAADVAGPEEPWVAEARERLARVESAGEEQPGRHLPPDLR